VTVPADEIDHRETLLRDPVTHRSLTLKGFILGLPQDRAKVRGNTITRNGPEKVLGGRRQEAGGRRQEAGAVTRLVVGQELGS